MANNSTIHQYFLLFLSLVFSLFFNSSLAILPVMRLNVISYGAIPDGVTDSTQAFLAAWTQACGSTIAAIIYVPRGRFLLRSVQFLGQCKNNGIVVRIGGTIVAPSDYRVIGNSDSWISFQDVDGVSIISGILDAKGTALWACKNSGNSCPSGATSLSFSKSKNIVIIGLTSLNSQMFHIVINACQNVKMHGVKIIAPGNSPNTDGIHVQLSSSVTILNTRIQTGDDCVSIGPGASNLWMENMACGPGHGISIGSLGKDQNEAGVQNVSVKTAAFVGTQNGVRIKSWARPSNGFARNIVFQHLIMNNVHNPIVIDQNYCPESKNCPDQISGVKVTDVTYQDIHGTSATKVAVKFDCSSRKPCTGIRLQDVKLTYMNQPAASSCSHADGTVSGLVQPTSCL